MRYGCCSNMISSGSGKTGAEIVEKLAMYGFDYIELSLVDCMLLSKADRRALARRLDGAGLHSEAINSLFPRNLKTTGPDVRPQEVRDWYMEALELAKALGAEDVVYGSPYSKSYPLGFDRARAHAQLVDLHKAMDAYAGQLGLRILVEPCHRFECNLINTFADGVALAKEINGENTGVLFDYYHFTRNGETLDALLLDGRQYLHHIHLACPFHPGEPERTFPLDRREWNYEPFVCAVHEIGYDGRLSIEAVCKDFDGQADRSLKTIKEMFE